MQSAIMRYGLTLFAMLSIVKQIKPSAEYRKTVSFTDMRIALKKFVKFPTKAVEICHHTVGQRFALG